MIRRVALNATAYDDGPSGAKERAVGLAAALLAEGVSVLLYVPAGAGLAALVEAEAGPAQAGDGLGEGSVHGVLQEVETPLLPAHPATRALRSAGWFERHLPADVDLFVTDYYPVLERVPTALTVHDLRYCVAPEHEPAARVAWFRAFYPRLARRAPLVVVPSRAVADEAVERLGVQRARIAVVPNGLSRPWRSAPVDPLAAEHFLMIGVAEPRKDARTALAAMRAAAARGPVPPLRIVGRAGRALDAALRSAGQQVEFVGVADPGELVRLCRGATALLHPSRYEGFGLPVLQALAVGVPVLAADGPAVAEVAAGGAELLPPGDVDAWAQALLRLAASDGRPRATEGAQRRARGFTWRSAARALLAAARGRASGTERGGGPVSPR